MKSLRFVFLIACFLGLTGCNTVKGMGQDIQKAGSAIEGAAKK
ncbi:entericidin A/B family lipoprotein [Rhodoferax sp.]|nr:entericidin A/B family lipoprotein [Rhodoferax sp.]MDR3370584.1 entericidin A/B family lipoprotein [Rhodoferax sp.]